MKIKFKAFTLIEMTIAICVIAIIAAAVTPNITKKLSTKAKANANQLTTNCSHFDFTDVDLGSFSGYCKSCYEHKCVSCKLDYIVGYAIIQNNCKYESCEILHGSSCKFMCNETTCLDSDTYAPSNWTYDYQ